MRLGLSTSYNEKADKYGFIRKLLALPFIPAEHTRETFGELEQLAGASCPEIIRLVNYVRTNWIDSSVWKPEHWSVFRETVRTNNDVEGWHKRLKSRASGSTRPFYVLVPRLRAEAEEVNADQDGLRKSADTQQQTKVQTHPRTTFDLWDKYEDGDITTSRLLRDCSHLLGLGSILATADDHGEEDN